MGAERRRDCGGGHGGQRKPLYIACRAQVPERLRYKARGGWKRKKTRGGDQGKKNPNVR